MKITTNQCFGWLGYLVRYRDLIYQILDFDWNTYCYLITPAFKTGESVWIPLEKLIGCEIVGDAWKVER